MTTRERTPMGMTTDLDFELLHPDRRVSTAVLTRDEHDAITLLIGDYEEVRPDLYGAGAFDDVDLGRDAEGFIQSVYRRRDELAAAWFRARRRTGLDDLVLLRTWAAEDGRADADGIPAELRQVSTGALEWSAMRLTAADRAQLVDAVIPSLTPSEVARHRARLAALVRQDDVALIDLFRQRTGMSVR